MGVPKFYRFISDRYPSINKTVKEYEIPEYENLYLDMNSIIHTCAHPSDSDVHFRIGKKEFSDEDIYQNVCRYVEILFSIVKPVDLMYLAFDGVAPRAKMNQQRGHRFYSAKDINKALIKNEVVQEDTLFDANCITTGTVFMAELIDHMKHFVAYKISTDSAWQKCKIIVSGPEVPGEGEHKIMEYIRYNKAQPDYNQNTRHCLYCFDADLIMLGLCTHEPHFSLIREKITFGKRNNMITPEESDFDLLHLSLLREYLEYEFTPIKSKLKFPFDLEKIIDDWVLIGFLVGNDFIPQLPNLNIIDGALPFLYQIYMKVLPTLEGYMNEFGELNVQRFKMYLHMLSNAQKILDEPSKIPQILVNESDSKDHISDNDSEIKVNGVDNAMESSENADDVEARRILIENAFNELELQSVASSEQCSVEHSEENEEPLATLRCNINEEQENLLLKNPISNHCSEDYYKTKLKFDEIDRTIISSVVEQYIKAIQWTLRYYYQGCCSWSWYYPYHYAPLISDFDKLEEVTFDFTMDRPFLPLQHLLAVLPPANVHLLPKPLHFLLENQKSPIIDFYPKDFEVDLNGKTNDWESIVLIPFIDESRLIKAMEPYVKKLSFKEQKRNKNGQTSVFTYTKISLGQYPVETIFDSFENHAQLDHKKQEDMYIPKDKLISGLSPNVSFDRSYPGFPTLKYIHHSFKFAQAQSKFNTHIPTKAERMILSVTPKLAKGLEHLAKEFLGQKAYACWPYLREVHIIGITDFKNKIMLINFWKGYNENNIKIAELLTRDVTSLHDEANSITVKYNNLFGIEIGETEYLFYLFPMIGKKYECTNNGNIQLNLKYGQSSKMFPYQLVIKDEMIQRYNFILYKTLNDLFNRGSTCYVTSLPNYGAKGEIQGIIQRQQQVSVMLEIPSEPDFSPTDKFFVADENYKGCSEVAKKLKINSTLISRITGSLIITDNQNSSRYHDIGLRMKYPKHEKQLFGYTRKDGKFWSYSEKAVHLIQCYMTEFPILFENLNKNINSVTFVISDLFPDGLAQVHLVKAWLSEQRMHFTTFLECRTKTLGLNGVPALEEHIADFYSKEHKQSVVPVQVNAQSLFIPGTLTGFVPPDFKAEHRLLDRLVCVNQNFTVPFGLKGTIIGIQGKQEKYNNVYEVLFDSPFTGGLTLYDSSEHRCYRLMATDFINVSFGQRSSKSERPPINGSSKVSKTNNNKYEKKPVNFKNQGKENIHNIKETNHNNQPKDIPLKSNNPRKGNINRTKENHHNNSQCKENSIKSYNPKKEIVNRTKGNHHNNQSREIPTESGPRKGNLHKNKENNDNNNQHKKIPMKSENPREDITNNNKENNQNNNQSKEIPKETANPNKTSRNTKVHNANGNSSNTRNQRPKSNFQAKKRNFDSKKNHNTAGYTKEPQDDNYRNQPDTNGTNTEENNARPNYTGTIPKIPLKKKNTSRFQNKENQNSRNGNSKKRITPGTHQTERRRDLLNSDTNQKDIDSKDDRKH